MKAQLETVSPRALMALAVVAVLVYSLAVWFLLVSPKRSEAASLGADIAAAEARLEQARGTADRQRGGGAPVADVFRLAKAMPASTDQPGLVLELDRLARASGVTLDSITTQQPVVGAGGATMIPVAVVVEGSYREITRFLARTRRLVNVRGGTLRATGRLLAVQNVTLSESKSGGFPQLDATITFNAFVYDAPIVPPSAPAAPADEPTDASGATAQGATP